MLDFSFDLGDRRPSTLNHIFIFIWILIQLAMGTFSYVVLCVIYFLYFCILRHLDTHSCSTQSVHSTHIHSSFTGEWRVWELATCRHIFFFLLFRSSHRDIFSLGFGPFRWVCTSGDPQDLAVTDDIAATVLEDISATVTDRIRQQYNDNIRWIKEAGKHQMVSDFLEHFEHDDDDDDGYHC